MAIFCLTTVSNVLFAVILLVSALPEMRRKLSFSYVILGKAAKIILQFDRILSKQS